MQFSDRVTGLFLVALGGLAAYGGSRLPPVPGQQVGPDVFPMVIGTGLCLCGALIALGVGKSFEEDPEDETLSATEVQSGPPDWWRGLMALIPPGLLLFYVLTVDRLGFVLTAGLMVLTTATALGARLRLAVPLAIVAPVLVHLLFSKLLRVPLPPGLIPMPW
ncbi:MULTISPECIES: tripartite tricarboxylate transporter TctB family protein [Rhodomicrobium]|uniref:tripartite tricarboxylate transporter TctB family protein n=1 Tax=Rhodomicrobium TaxID=1068 RepID=UPI000B4B0DC3|nr:MULTISPECIES: tripartite tricarboxylate transporter TctB family protein [Rhodomicrobium]